MQEAILLSLLVGEIRLRKRGAFVDWPTPAFTLRMRQTERTAISRSLRQLEQCGLVLCRSDDSGTVVGVQLTTDGRQCAREGYMGRRVEREIQKEVSRTIHTACV